MTNAPRGSDHLVEVLMCCVWTKLYDDGACREPGTDHSARSCDRARLLGAGPPGHRPFRLGLHAHPTDQSAPTPHSQEANFAMPDCPVAADAISEVIDQVLPTGA